MPDVCGLMGSMPSSSASRMVEDGQVWDLAGQQEATYKIVTGLGLEVSKGAYMYENIYTHMYSTHV